MCNMTSSTHTPPTHTHTHTAYLLSPPPPGPAQYRCQARRGGCPPRHPLTPTPHRRPPSPPDVMAGPLPRLCCPHSTGGLSLCGGACGSAASGWGATGYWSVWPQPQRPATADGGGAAGSVCTGEGDAMEGGCFGGEGGECLFGGGGTSSWHCMHRSGAGGGALWGGYQFLGGWGARRRGGHERLALYAQVGGREGGPLITGSHCCCCVYDLCIACGEQKQRLE